MRDILRALRYIGDVSVGSSRPKIVECCDHKLYVLKTSCPQFPRLAVNELLAAALGSLVSAPVIEGFPILVENEFVENTPQMVNPDGSAVSPGVHFAAPWLQPAVTDPSVEMLRDAVNRTDVPWVFAFDQWIFNPDRSANPGNLLFSRLNDRRGRIFMIDHGHAFSGFAWDLRTLRDYEEYVHLGFGALYGVLGEFVRGADPFSRQLEVLEGLTPADIKHVVESLPDELRLGSDEEVALTTFLFRRSRLVHGFLDRLRPSLKGWG